MTTTFDIETTSGRFSCFAKSSRTSGLPIVLIISAMGFSSTRFDFYNVLDCLDPNKYVGICVDLLGSGFSGAPISSGRSLDNISSEIANLIQQLNSHPLFLMAHSLSAIYMMKLLSNRERPQDVAGFIGIDPTAPKTITHFLDEFRRNLEEVRQLEKNKSVGRLLPDPEINPLLSLEASTACRDLYESLPGAQYIEDELRQAPQTVADSLGLVLPDEIPSLSILSTQNYADYAAYGNPYFNANRHSAQTVLNGHHFLQWIHPQTIAMLIGGFVDIVTSD